MRFNQLHQWLDWLDTLKKTRSPTDALLDAVTMAKRLEIFPPQNKVISVSGTNGKGSCVSLLETIYSEAGYQVGAFTSPHLLKFNERICINKKQASDQTICEAFDLIDRTRQDIQLTYFQFTFLAALIIFHQNPLDILILEVGIGGLYDVVNIIDADLSIISSIDLDHCEKLGKTREEIAIQKAGIMRKDKPAICGDLNPPKNLQKSADRIGAVLYQQNKDFNFQNHQNSWDFQTENLSLNHLPKPTIDLSNASSVLMAISCLNDIMPVSQQTIITGLKKAYLPARLELIELAERKILLDVAHNPSAIAHLLQYVQGLAHIHKKYLVFGMLQDKDIMSSLHLLVSNDIDKWFLTTLTGPRGTEAKYLADRLEDMGIENVSCYDTPISAFQSAFEQTTAKDLIIVCGSFHTVGNIMENILIEGTKWTKN